MPDGNFYTVEGHDLYIYNGKGVVTLTKSAGSATSLTTDGQNIFMGSNSRIYKKSKAADFEIFSSLPITQSTTVAATKDGKVYFAGRDGIGFVQQGKVNFTDINDITGFPKASIQSIAVNNKNELLLFADSMYKYANGKVSGVAGTKGLLYLHYFDSKGGQYSSDGSSKGFYLKDNKVTPLTEILRNSYGFSPTEYIGTSSITMDYKGRIWLVGNYQKKTYLHLIEDGKVVSRFDEKEFPLLKSITAYLYSYQKKLYVVSSTGGMMLYDLK